MPNQLFRRFSLLMIVFGLCLAACVPAAPATGAFVPTDIPPTLAPTHTPVPPIASPTPSATLAPSATPTDAPKATSAHAVSVATSVPSATPAPGDVVYQARFADDWDHWDEFYF